MREKYSTDLTDEQWAIIATLFKGMRNRKWSKRDLFDAVLYLVDNGCKWRNLPHDFSTLFNCPQFLSSCKTKRFVGQNFATFSRGDENKSRKNPNPTYAIIDSQSVDTAYKSEQIGFDGGKKTKDINATS